MSRRSRMTPQYQALFREQAEVHIKKKSLKALAKLTGFAPSYCWAQIQIQVQRMRVTEKVSVSRETIGADTLGNHERALRNAESDPGQLQASHDVR